MIETIEGVVISSKDYNEKDSIVTVFSKEKGIVNLFLKNSKAPKSKLRFAKQNFCYGVFFLSEKKTGLLSVSDFEVKNLFLSLANDYDNFIEICEIVKILKTTLMFEQENLELFNIFLKILNVFSQKKQHKYLILSKFLLDIFAFSGFGLNFDYCAECGKKIIGDCVFNEKESEFFCLNHKKGGGVQLSSFALNNLKFINMTDYSKLNSLSLSSFDECLGLLIKNFQFRFNETINLY